MLPSLHLSTEVNDIACSLSLAHSVVWNHWVVLTMLMLRIEGLRNWGAARHLGKALLLHECFVWRTREIDRYMFIL